MIMKNGSKAERTRKQSKNDGNQSRETHQHSHLPNQSIQLLIHLFHLHQFAFNQPHATFPLPLPNATK